MAIDGSEYELLKGERNKAAGHDKVGTQSVQ